MAHFEARIRMPQLDRWLFKESMTVLAPDGQANIIASSEPLDPSIDVEQYARVQGDLLRKEFQGYRELSFVPSLVFGGRPGYIREFEWAPPDGVAVTQIQVYYAGLGRGYTATATTPSSLFPRYRDVLRDAMAAITLASSGGADRAGAG